MYSIVTRAVARSEFLIGQPLSRRLRIYSLLVRQRKVISSATRAHLNVVTFSIARALVVLLMCV
jgi:hypothetical protein